MELNTVMPILLDEPSDAGVSSTGENEIKCGNSDGAIELPGLVIVRRAVTDRRSNTQRFRTQRAAGRRRGSHVHQLRLPQSWRRGTGLLSPKPSKVQIGLCCDRNAQRVCERIAAESRAIGGMDDSPDRGQARHRNRTGTALRQ
jgi:hypothetical protein